MTATSDHDHIHDAIAEAEQGTSGEIFCVVARESGDYREVPLAWAGGVALLAPPLALFLGFSPEALARGLQALSHNGWVAAHAGSLEASVIAALVGYATLQAALFVIVLAAASITPVRRLMTPSSLKRSHVHVRALEQFAHRLHAIGDRTGVLIYASLAERRVEIVADEDIHAKVGEAAWDRAIAAALPEIRAGDHASGLAAAIKICGEVLAAHFPPTGAGAAAGDVAEI